MIVTLIKVFTMASVGFMSIPNDLPVDIHRCSCASMYKENPVPDVELQCDVDKVLGGIAAHHYNKKTDESVEADYLLIRCEGEYRE